MGRWDALTSKEPTKVLFVAKEIPEDGRLPAMRLHLALVKAKEIAIVLAPAEKVLAGFVKVVAQRVQRLFPLLVSLQLVRQIVVIAALDVVRRGTRTVQRQDLMGNLLA